MMYVFKMKYTGDVNIDLKMNLKIPIAIINKLTPKCINLVVFLIEENSHIYFKLLYKWVIKMNLKNI